MVTKQAMRGRDFDTRGAITYTFSGRVIETQPTIPAPPSPEPPVTPKIIATIDVFENPQKIVGIVIDAETGDSTTVLPKSFEVDGIPQPLDAIGAEVDFDRYTFETLGEHTITYELDNPTIIPASQFNRVNLISVQLPVGITSIGDYAFIECINLTSITVNATTPPTLGEDAFNSTNNCPIFVPDASVDAYKTAWSEYASRIKPLSQKFFVKLTVQDYTDGLVGEPREVELEGSGELTHEMVFTYMTYEIDPETGDGSGTCITSMIIGDLCTSIGDYCYAPLDDDEDSILGKTCMYFRNLVISRTVISIGDNAFDGIYGGPNITVDAANTTYDSRNNCNAIIQTSTNTLIRGCSATVISNTVTSIGNYAFDGCTSLSNITIPNSVTSIGAYAFFGCTSLSNITIPSGVTSIDGGAFDECTSLTSMTINAITPPTLGIDTLRGSYTIFVPSESVQAYKNAWNTAFRDYADRIQAIS